MAELKKRLPGAVGPSYKSKVSRSDDQRTINAYLELDEAGTGKGGEPATLIGTPGLLNKNELGLGPSRGSWTLSNQELSIFVSGNEVYQLAGVAAIPVQITGNLLTNAGPVSIVDNGIQCILVDGTAGYYFTIGETVLHQIVDANFYPADIVTEQDGYFILNQSGTSNFFISDLYSIDFPPLNTANKSSYPDVLIAVISLNKQLYLLGAKTTELWWNSGASGITPFVSQPGKVFQFGCVSAASVAQLDNNFFWLGQNANGGGIVFMVSNEGPNRVSNFYIENELSKLGNLDGATAYVYQQNGHSFYVLNVPGAGTTYVYDVNTKQWEERQSTIDGTIGRHLGQTHCYLQGQHVIGDYRNGNIYTYDLDTFTDNGESRRFVRQFPYVSENLNNMFCHLLEVDFKFGVGLVDNGSNPGNAVSPKLVLRISKDGGQTFGNPITATLGQLGQWNVRARWQRLGMARSFLFRIECTDPVQIQMLSAQIQVEEGTS